MADGRRPLQPDDLFRLKNLGDPQISPDGRLIAYTVSETLRETDGGRSSIWIVASDGGEPRRLTNGPRQDHSPRWSPDGRRVAFVSNRLEGKRPQIWCIPVDGGEATVVTDVPSGVAGPPLWSPDGKRIAFVSRVGPADPGRGPRVVQRLRTQLNGAGFLGDSFWHVFVVEVAPHAEPASARQVTNGSWHHFHPAWSPDSARLALVTTRRPDWDLEWVWDIAVVSADGDGSDLRFITRSEGVALGPSWSPDGRLIAYFDNRCTTTGSTKDYHLWVAPVDGSGARNLSAALDRGALAFEPPANVTPAVWLRNGDSLAWLVSDAGQPKIAIVDVEGRNPRIVFAGPPVPLAFSHADEGERLALLGGTATAPGEIYAARLGGAETTQLTDVNGEVCRALSLSEPESFTLPAPDGFAVESRLWLPPGYRPEDGPLPTLVHFHGGPHGAVGTHFSFLYQLFAGHGYAVLAVNYRGSNGYGAAFADTILGDWGPRELEDSLAAFDALVQRGIADPARLGVYGASYGGFMTNYAIAHSNRFRAAATLATISNLETLAYLTDQWESIDWDNGGPPWERPDYYRQHSPISNVARITTPLLIAHGEADLSCPIAEAEQLFVALRKLRRTVEFVRYPGESHSFVSHGRPSTRLDLYQRLLDWFDRHLRS